MEKCLNASDNLVLKISNNRSNPGGTNPSTQTKSKYKTLEVARGGGCCSLELTNI